MPWVVSPVPWKPHAGQRKGVKFLLEHACAAILADPGVGKTTIVYGALKILMKKGLVKRTLIIAPLRPCYLVWPQEAAKWADFQDLRVEVLHGPGKEEALQREADVYVINPEGLDWLLGAVKTRSPIKGRMSVTVDLKGFKELGFDLLVIDELSKFKHPTSGRHKAVDKVAHLFTRRWGLTGSPAPNGLMDLFGECKILDGGKAFGRFITHFRAAYFIPSYDGVSYDLKKGAQTEIYKRIAPLACRLDAKDYIDMPQLISNKIMFDLPPEARRIYDGMEDDLITTLGGHTIEAANAAVASMKCRQIASGGIYTDPEIIELLKKSKKMPKAGGREWLMIHDLKTDILADLVSELQGQPLLVAYDFAHDLARLQARFKNVPYIGGGTSSARAIDLERRWNRGEIPLLLGHPQSIGHGLNLQESSCHVAWYSMTYDLELYEQLNGRVWRQGNPRARVFVHHIMAKNTVDEVIYWALQEKNTTQRNLLDALKKMRVRRK